MITEELSLEQTKGLQAAREMGIAVGQLGFSEEYDAAFAPFMKLAGQIGQYERALKTYNNSPNIRYWIVEQRKLEKQFIAQYRTLFINSQASIQILPQKWIMDFYSGLNHSE